MPRTLDTSKKPGREAGNSVNRAGDEEGAKTFGVPERKTLKSVETSFLGGRERRINSRKHLERVFPSQEGRGNRKSRERVQVITT